MVDPQILADHAALKQRLDGIEARLTAGEAAAAWPKRESWYADIDAAPNPVIGGGDGSACPCGCGGLCGGLCGNPNCTCGRSFAQYEPVGGYGSPW